MGPNSRFCTLLYLMLWHIHLSNLSFRISCLQVTGFAENSIYTFHVNTAICGMQHLKDAAVGTCRDKKRSRVILNYARAVPKVTESVIRHSWIVARCGCSKELCTFTTAEMPPFIPSSEDNCVRIEAHGGHTRPHNQLCWRLLWPLVVVCIRWQWKGSVAPMLADKPKSFDCAYG